MGGGQKAACNLEGRWILISAFKAGEDREDNLTLISILSTGGKKRKEKGEADTGVMGGGGGVPEDPGDSSPFSCLSIYISSCSLSAPDLLHAWSGFTN